MHKVILIGAQRLSCGSQRLSCGAQGYPAVHNGYPGLTWVGARDTCVSKKVFNLHFTNSQLDALARPLGGEQTRGPVWLRLCNRYQMLFIPAYISFLYLTWPTVIELIHQPRQQWPSPIVLDPSLEVTLSKPSGSRSLGLQSHL